MLAFAAIIACSAARISGRRSSSAEGRPAGTSGGAYIKAEGARAFDVPRVFPEQQRHLVLRLFDLLPRVGECSGCAVHELLSGAHIEQGGDAVALPFIRRVEAIRRASPACSGKSPARSPVPPTESNQRRPG